MMGSLVDRMIDFEMGISTEDGMINLFQELIDNGMAWTLQGSYGRAATRLIEAGLCSRKEVS